MVYFYIQAIAVLRARSQIISSNFEVQRCWVSSSAVDYEPARGPRTHSPEHLPIQPQHQAMFVCWGFLCQINQMLPFGQFFFPPQSKIPCKKTQCTSSIDVVEQEEMGILNHKYKVSDLYAGDPKVPLSIRIVQNSIQYLVYPIKNST